MTLAQQRLTLGAHIAEVTSDNSAIVMRLDSSECEPLEMTGSALLVWQTLRSGAHTVDETVARCSRETGMPPEALEEDVTRFLERLVSLGLLATG